MDWVTPIALHESASPHATRERIIERLRGRALDPSILYSGLRQTSLWIELHRAVSPARRDPAVTALYPETFASIAGLETANVIHVISLACGDGAKDLTCLRSLRDSRRAVLYTPADISFEMVAGAQRAAVSALRGLQCTPLVCELSRCSVLPAILKQFDPSGAERLILFLGTIHNYWPPEIFKSILHPLRSQDRLLIGANLAPAQDYEASLSRILLQYDNEPTRRWLLGALSELGLMPEDGELTFALAPAETLPDLKRIEASFLIQRPVELSVLGEKFLFPSGTALQVFYSYRFTPDHLRSFLEESGLAIEREWLLPEEGLFLCRRTPQ